MRSLQGILDDGIDGDTAEDPFKLDDAAKGREARTKARLGLKEVGHCTTMLLGGDNWLGAPLAVPEDVRDRGEQQIGEEVTYWNTHSGQIGTGSGGGATYPYARAQRGQMLLAPQAQTQILNRLVAEEANAQMDDMFDAVATNEEVHQYAERRIDISSAAESHRASYGVENW